MDYSKDDVFVELIRLVINTEGKYSNNPNDKGGPTMYGVAWNYNHGYLKAKLKMKKPTDVQYLTIDQARQLYYVKYWIPSNGSGITDVDLAYIHLDAAINCGVGQAAIFLRNLSVNPKDFDGSKGKNRTLFLRLFLEYTALRLSFYTHARDRDVFLEGWVNRMVIVIRNSFGLE